MKIRLLAMVIGLMPAMLFAASSADLKLPSFDGLEARATDSVNLSLDPWMLRLAGVFMDDSEGDAKDTKRILNGIRSIQIRSFEFAQDGVYPAAEIESVRRQLSAPGWNRLLQTRNAATSENVDIYLMSEDRRPRGFALICSEPRSFTIISIAGNVSVEDMVRLQKHVNLSGLRRAAVL